MPVIFIAGKSNPISWNLSRSCWSVPPGSVKTYFGKVWAAVVIGDKNALERVDMSDYGAAHTVAKMSGSPPGYVDFEKPGLWTRLFRQHKSVFVAILDEIEKAHPRVFDYLMPAFRPGTLNDKQGNTTHWKNVTVVLTSNLGMTDPESDKDKSNRARIEKIFEVLLKGDEDQLTHEVNKALSEIVQQAVKSFLRPEMVNRMTVPTPIFFKWLHPDDVRQLIDQVWLKELEKDLANQGSRSVLILRCIPA